MEGFAGKESQCVLHCDLCGSEGVDGGIAADYMLCDGFAARMSREGLLGDGARVFGCGHRHSQGPWTKRWGAVQIVGTEMLLPCILCDDVHGC